MSFLYPRLISIYRPAPLSGVGEIAYGGIAQPLGTLVKAGVPASIQFKRAGSKPDVGLPSDPALSVTSHRIFIPKASAALGLINPRDIVVDDTGRRYIVVDPYWNSLGYQLVANILEA